MVRLKRFARWARCLRPSRHVAAYLLLSTGVILGFYSDYHNTQAQEQNRIERRAQINHAIQLNCLEIEGLKRNVRQDAIDQYQRLDQTLKLLKIKKTRPIINEAAKIRDRKLETYQPESCPRPVKDMED
jgi:hypothetical protein